MKHMYMIGALAMMTLVGCVGEDDTDLSLETQQQELYLAGSNGQTCTYRGTMTCTSNIWGTTTHSHTEYVAAGPGGSCAPDLPMSWVRGDLTEGGWSCQGDLALDDTHQVEQAATDYTYSSGDENGDDIDERKTITNCTATCTNQTAGCCATSTGKCKYRPSDSTSWEHGETENGGCVINGRVVGYMPTSEEAESEKELMPEGNGN